MPGLHLLLLGRNSKQFPQAWLCNFVQPRLATYVCTGYIPWNISCQGRKGVKVNGHDRGGRINGLEVQMSGELFELV